MPNTAYVLKCWGADKQERENIPFASIWDLNMCALRFQMLWAQKLYTCVRVCASFDIDSLCHKMSESLYIYINIVQIKMNTKKDTEKKESKSTHEPEWTSKTYIERLVNFGGVRSKDSFKVSFSLFPFALLVAAIVVMVLYKQIQIRSYLVNIYKK